MSQRNNRVSHEKKRHREENECEAKTSKRLRSKNMDARESMDVDDAEDSLMVRTQMESLLGVPEDRRCGKIQRLHLKDFMCHTNLVIDFSTRINFLVGRNGSGKSAIMVGLALGLGAKAKATNRSSNLKQFIRTGQLSAVIEVTILNEGIQAFEPEVYGNRIIVVRTINQTGSTYAIKNALGHVVSRQASILHHILLYHNIQVDNPVFMLNQDCAREFLKDMDPSKNYQLFLRATLISAILEKLNGSLQIHRQHKYNLSIQETKLKNDTEKIKQLQIKLAQIESADKIEQNLCRLELEHLWVLVTEHEKKLKKFLRDIKKIEEEKLELSNSLDNRDDMATQLTQHLRKHSEELELYGQKFREHNKLHMESKDKANKANQNCVEIQSYLDGYAKREKFINNQIVELRTYLDEGQHTNTNDIDDLRRQNELKLEELRSMAEENIAIIESAKRDLKLFIDNKIKRESTISETVSKLSHWEDNIRRLNGNINSIKSSKKDQLSIYGENVIAFVKEIDRLHANGKFTEKPIGPLGRYIQIPNGAYRDIVEPQIRGVLQAYLVNDSKDCLVLDAVLKQKFRNFQPTFITTRFQKKVYDVGSGRVRPPRGTTLLMDEIESTEPDVMNCLIDRCSIERVLLTTKRNIAEQLTESRENVPENLLKVLAVMTESRMYLEYFPEPGYRMYSCKIVPARFIQVNVQQRIDQLEIEKQNIEVEKQKTEHEIHSLRSELRRDMQLVDEKRRLVEQHESKKYDLKEKIDELNNFEYPDSNMIDVLKNELAENEKKLESLLQNILTRTEEMKLVKNDLHRYEEETHKWKASVQDIQKGIEELNKKFNDEKVKMRNLDSHFQSQQTRLADIQKKFDCLQKERRSLESDLQTAIAAAEAKGERIASSRNEETIQEQMQLLQRQLNKQRKKVIEDPEILKISLTQYQEVFEEDNKNFESFNITVDLLEKSLIRRFDLIKKMKQHMVIILQFMFTQILRIRNFEGTITVSHRDEKLLLKVVPRDNHIANAVSGTKSLSGGERSFTTVALLISLWACVDHPFYFLDEYDVFSDDVNREYMTRLLISEGRKWPTRQYIFLTPQDMALEANDLIKIHRLSTPEK